MSDYVFRFLRWVVGKIGLRTLLMLLLLFLALRSLALGLAEVTRGLDANLALTVVVVAMFVGWLLGKLSSDGHVRGWLAGLAIVIGGVFFLIVRVAQLGDELLAVAGAAPPIIVGLFRWRAAGPPDASPLLIASLELLIGIGALLGRLAEWVLAVSRGQSAFDPVSAALMWGLAVWLVAAWAGWAVRRREQPLQGLIPAIALVITVRYYAGANANAILIPVGATLLLAALVQYNARLAHWRIDGFDFPEDLWQDVTKAAILLTLTLMITAWLLPSISIRDAARSFQKLFEQQSANTTNPVPEALGLNRQAGPGSAFALDYIRAPGLPRSHLLTAGPELAREVAMLVTVRGLPANEPPPRFYWRSVSYNIYTGRGWATSGTQTIEYAANEAPLAASPGHRTIDQEVRIISDQGGLLYTAGTLLTTNQDYSIAWRSNEDYFGANISLGTTTYRALSMTPVYSEDQLQSAGTDYPQWVIDHYLALPDEVPARVLDLARNLTATERTPYDRARAIEKYLRTYTYTLDIAAPPPNRDVADYFLFDLRRGYCDYYATSMVVLARAAGLPARLVIGYASGTYDNANNRYVVTEADAHSWVEVFFPGYGWIEFEPTGGRAELDRPSEATVAAFAELESTPQPDPAQQARPTPQGWLILLTSVGVLIGLGVGWAATEGWRLNRLSPASALTIIYEHLRHHTKRLAVVAETSDTADEFAESLLNRLAALAANPRWRESLAEAAEESDWLIELYKRASYSPRPPTADERARAVQTWLKLRWQLWVVWALHPARTFKA